MLRWKKLGMGTGSLLLPLLLVGACGNDSSCPAGYAGCACTPDATCQPGLVCSNDLRCIDPNGQNGSGGENNPGSGGTGSGGTGTGGTGNNGQGTIIDPQGCLACWQS